MPSRHPKRNRWLGAILSSAFILALCGAGYGLYVLPTKRRVERLERQVLTLEQTRKTAALKESTRRAEAEKARKNEGRAVFARAEKILSLKAPLGVKSLQLRLIEAIARAAQKAGLQEFTYQDAAKKWTHVVKIKRQKEDGAPYEEDVYRSAFKVNILSDYKGVAAFLEQLSKLEQTVVPGSLKLNRKSDAMLRGSVTLWSYVRIKE